MLSTATAVIIIAVVATDPPAQRRGRFAETPDITLGEAGGLTASLSFLDVDGDGDLDIVVGNVGMQNAVYYNERNDGSFREERFGFDDAMTYWVALGDVDDDGRLDIAVVNSGGQSGIYLNRIAKGQ